MQQLSFQFIFDPRCSAPSRHGHPRSPCCQFQDQIPAFSALSLGIWGATSEKRRLCLLLIYNSWKGGKKKVFINLNIFPDICAFIYCVFLYKTYGDPTPTPQWWHFGSSAGTSRVMAIFGPFSVAFGVHTEELRCYLSGQSVAAAGRSGTASYL